MMGGWIPQRYTQNHKKVTYEKKRRQQKSNLRVKSSENLEEMWEIFPKTSEIFLKKSEIF